MRNEGKCTGKGKSEWSTEKKLSDNQYARVCIASKKSIITE